MSTLQDYLKASTLLEATNVLLESISGTTVASLDAADTNVDVGVALARIGEVLRETQIEGWCWNQELDYVIDPNSSGEIILPSNTARCIQRYTGATYRKRLMVRGSKLYDTIAHSFNIGVPVKVDLTVILDFEDLPEAARQYVVLKAARRFASGRLSSGTVYQITKADEDQARIRMEQEAAEMSPDTMHENPHILRMRRRRTSGLHW